MRLEELTKGSAVKGILPQQTVKVIDVKWFGSDALELTYKDPGGRLGNELLYRHNQDTLEIVTPERPWSFNADGALLRLVADTVTVTKNEILTALNKPEDYILALVQVPHSQEFIPGDVSPVKPTQSTYQLEHHSCIIRYIQRPFQKEPDFDVTSVNYNWRKLWERGNLP